LSTVDINSYGEETSSYNDGLTTDAKETLFSHFTYISTYLIICNQHIGPDKLETGTPLNGRPTGAYSDPNYPQQTPPTTNKTLQTSLCVPMAAASSKRLRVISAIAIFIIAVEYYFLFSAHIYLFREEEEQKERKNNNDRVMPFIAADSLGHEQKRHIDDRPQEVQEEHEILPEFKLDYSRLETSAPPVLRASSPGTLPSLPEKHLIPDEVINAKSFETYFSNWSLFGDPSPLFVYNPSIVPTIFYNFLSSNHSIVNEFHHLKYLVTFRLSSVHSCGFPTVQFWRRSVNFLGLAFLDDQLKIAKELSTEDGESSSGGEYFDVVIDIDHHLGRIFPQRRWKQAFEDFRLFILHDRLFLGSRRLLFSICLSVETASKTNHTIAAMSSPLLCKADVSSLTEIPILFKSTDRLRLFHDGIAFELDTFGGAKNMQYFQIVGKNSGIDHGNNKTLMEFFPSGPRQVYDLGTQLAQKIAINELTKQTLEVAKTIGEWKNASTFDTEMIPEPVNPLSRELDQKLKKWFFRDRGSACCITIEKKYYEDFFLSSPVPESVQFGMAHAKTYGKKPSSQGPRFSYASRLYAFSSSEPYELIARSALFCFGFTQDTDVKGNLPTGNLYSLLTYNRTKYLELKGTTYECPHIHFVSGMTEKVDDPSRIIVAYGVNDCVPRFVEVLKRHVMMHLFSENGVMNE